MLTNKGIITAIITVGSTLTLASETLAATVVKVTIENLSPTNGTFITPVWVGFHNGGFDIYDRGAPAALFLERLAEDGTTTDISNAFSASGAGTHQSTLFGPTIPPLAPGETTSAIFTLDENSTNDRYFSYASMIIPSNDAFIANGNPFAFPIFDDFGNFLGANFIVSGSNVLDAGTEVNDEIPINTAFLGQTTPNTGTDENGTVEIHPGFIPNGAILSDSRFANADFTAPGYQVVRISVQQVSVPEPSGIMGLLFISGLLLRNLKSE